MEQVYLPNVLVSAIPGWCLRYVDDAGNAPNRTATARYSWEVERDAGRIRNTDTPDNIWVVGWLDFTKGMYQTYGHVFLIKRSGGNYQIYDSEVQSGKRKPYGSIKELLAWFGAYSPVYTGWSTHCDGREYAKEETMSKIQTEREAQLLLGIGYMGDPTGSETKALVGQEYAPSLEYIWTSKVFNDNKWVVLVGYPNALKEIAELKKKLQEQGNDEYIKVNDIYVKK